MGHQILDLALMEHLHQPQNQKNFMRWLMQQKHLRRPASCWMMMENFHQWLSLPHEKCFSEKDHRGRHQEKYEKVKIHFSITVPIYHNQNEQNLMNKYF